MRRKKICTILLMLALTAAPEILVMADAVGTFEEVKSQQGEMANNYIYDITADGKKAQEIIVFDGVQGKTYTETHIREEASASSKYVRIIPANTTVTIWGTTSNGWTKVFFEDEKEGSVTGYIRADLLR